MNICELCGSEQAVTSKNLNESIENDEIARNLASLLGDNSLALKYMSRVKQFATESFNSLSSSMLKSALKGKVKSERNPSIITNCLSESMSKNSKILFICCVSPLTENFSHSLPALKFCARIRDCILKNLEKLKEK